MDWFSRNGWSLSDYQRRVSPTATIEAFYQVRSLFEVHNIMITGGTFVNTQNINVHNFAAGGEMYSGRDFTLLIIWLILRILNRAQRTYHDILGLAAGGKMYGGRDFTLLIIWLILRILNRAQKIYRDKSSPRVRLDDLV